MPEISVFAQRLREAEVEDVRRPVTVHEDIRRLEVAVQDAALVCVVDRARDGDRESDASAQREAAAIAVPVDGLAID